MRRQALDRVLRRDSRAPWRLARAVGIAVLLALVMQVMGLWTPAAAATGDAINPQVAVDSNGNAVAVWLVYDGANYRVQARRRSASGTLSPVKTLSGAGVNASSPQVGVDSTGDAVVVWTVYDGANYRVQARRRTASGGLSTVQTLSPAGLSAYSPQVAVDGSGHAVVVWLLYDGADYRIQARRRTASGGLSSVKTLSGAGLDASSPQVGVDSTGDAVVVWPVYNGANQLIQARRRTASGALSTVQTLSPAGQNAFTPEVAVDPGGHAVVVWQVYDGADYRVQARRRSASGNLSSVQALSGAGLDAFYPDVGVDRRGNAVAAWMVYDGANYRVQARRRTASGGLSTVQALSATGVSAYNPEVAVDRSGNAVAAWMVNDGANYRIQARRRTASGGLSTLKYLSQAGQSAQSPQVGSDGSGNVVAVWQLYDSVSWSVQARRRSASGSLGAVQTLSATG